jgi:ferritin-like metal-binding protein YciE
MANTAIDLIQTVYIPALKSTHALEMQALQIMERQVERLENYPEMEQILRRHIGETHAQRDRLEEALSRFNESPSTVKETVLGAVGNLMAAGHIPAQDEILKNTYANHAFENFEIAAYKSLITIAESVGQTGSLSAFQQSLQEEQTTARLINEQIEPITRKYLMLTQKNPASAKI